MTTTDTGGRGGSIVDAPEVDALESTDRLLYVRSVAD